jgi:hypothetical protein
MLQGTDVEGINPGVCHVASCSPRLLGSQELEPGARSRAILLNISGENFGETALAAEP